MVHWEQVITPGVELSRIFWNSVTYVSWGLEIKGAVNIKGIAHSKNFLLGYF